MINDFLVVVAVTGEDEALAGVGVGTGRLVTNFLLQWTNVDI